MTTPAHAARVVIDDVRPRIRDGEVAIRRVPGDTVEVEADVLVDGSLGVRAAVRWGAKGTGNEGRVLMDPIGNDRWKGSFTVGGVGTYQYVVEGWTDPYLTWRQMLDRRSEAASVTPLDIQEGAAILRQEARRIRGAEGSRLGRIADEVERASSRSIADGITLARDPTIGPALAARPNPKAVVRSRPLEVLVDPPIAQHSAWYELFPRSTSPDPTRPGTLRDLAAHLPYIADLGFDVVYLSPIHPIGRVHRRGPNNTVPAPPGAPGSPWAIGSADGGHFAIHPELGTIEDFRSLVRKAKGLGLAIALDIAFQCAPDHPWISEHPDWFAHLPDGSIRPAENPPKRYDDICPLDFGTKDWQALWAALKQVVEFWLSEGVQWFRVDNPHTKPFAFWEWLIREVRREHPEAMFLAEAFTRPKIMYQLAEVGFTHSYTYFAWRTLRAELTDYFEEISAGEVGEYFRPHLWPNTPDILTEQFHGGRRSVFVQRLILAGTLSSHYGIYGPPYELLQHVPRSAGSEEYLNSEKYEIRHWDLGRSDSLAPEIRRLNQVRRAHPALTAGRRLRFHRLDNDQLVAYSRSTPDGSETILVVVNLDPEFPQSGWTNLDLTGLGLKEGSEYDVVDLWAGARYRWRGARNFVRLDPSVAPAHLFLIEPRGHEAGRN
jgi:starch synthase (maltosyl-transferring)